MPDILVRYLEKLSDAPRVNATEERQERAAI
jgi:hypothetical protein